MRERAEVATPGPWGYYGHSIIRPAELKDGKAPSYSAAYHQEDAEHIASWHPAVALAVADWLDDHAETIELFAAREIPGSAWSMNWQTSHNHALTVARAYLDEPTA